MTRRSWAGQRPEPARLWVRWRPRAWPRPLGSWTDVAAGELGEPGDPEPAFSPEAPAAGADDVVWLPPVPPAGERARRELAAGLAAAGVPVLLQVATASGEESSGPDPAGGLADLGRLGVTVLLDPLPALLAAGPEPAVASVAAAARALPGAAVVWPLIPGFGAGQETARFAARALADSGASALQPIVLRLTAAQRRRLAEGRGAEVFDALFHRPPPGERPFARAAAAAGIAPWLPRPLPRPPLAGAETRELAGLLALAGELWLRCGRAPAAGQALFRAARWADDAGYDLGALEREGNLGVVGAFDERSRAIVADAAAGRTPALVQELIDDYTAPEEAGAATRRAPAVATVSEEVGNG